MSRRLLRFLIGLYPRRWRRRYGDELEELVAELAARGDRTRTRLALGLLTQAAAERIRRPRWQIAAVLGMVTAVSIATALTLTAPAQHRKTVLAQATPPGRGKGAVPTRRSRLKQVRRALRAPNLTCFVGSSSTCSEIPCREFVVGGAAVATASLPAGRKPASTPTILIPSVRRRCVSNPSVSGQTFLVRDRQRTAGRDHRSGRSRAVGAFSLPVVG